MNTQNFIGDFIEFYLLPTHSQKTIELTQLKVLKKLKDKEPDVLLNTTRAIRFLLTLLKKQRKHRTPSHFENLNPLQKAYLMITHLDPTDCLLLISKDRYQLDDLILSLAIQLPEENLIFRRTQLQRQLSAEAITLPDFKTFEPKSILFTPQKQSRPLLYHFKSLPLLVRFAIETASVLCILFLFMWIIPEMRNRYEQAIQKKINDYFIESSLLDSPPPAGTTREPKLPPQQKESNDAEVIDANEKSSSLHSEETNKRQPKVVEGETWRFSFTGALTNEIETGVIGILKNMEFDQSKPLTVPGGIQFDFVVPTQKLIALKTALEEMEGQLQKHSQNKGSETPGTTVQTAISMSWYKKRNMGTRKIPSGTVQVIIWISTL